MKRILFVFILVVLFQNSDLKCFEYLNNLSGNYEEGIYQLHYANVVNKPLQVIIKDSSTYLPFSEILSYLKIYYHYDPSIKLIRGFYINPDSIWYIDLERKIAQYKNHRIDIAYNDILVSDFDIYVPESFFTQLLNLKIIVHSSQLLIDVNERTELPVLTEYKRKLRYEALGAGEGGDSDLIKFGRNRSFINGAMLDYNLSATSYRNSLNYNVGLNYGMEIFGGDLQVNSNGYMNPNSHIRTFRSEGRWRYFVSENSYFTQFSAGNLINLNYRVTTLPYQQVRGIQISNELTRIPNIFSNSKIIDNTEPGTQVELWINGQLTDQAVADPSGNVQFYYPVNYGMSNLTLKYYGTNGDYKEKREIYHIPTEFVKPGELKYSLTAGEKIYNKNKIIEGRFFYGITNWLTNSVSVERDFTTNKFNYYNTLITRIGSSITPIFDISDRLYKARIRAWFDDFGNYDLSYSKFNGISDLNQTGALYSTVGSVSFPRLFTLPFNLNINGNMYEYTNYRNINCFTSANFNLYPFYLETKYTYSSLKIKSYNTYIDQYATFNLYYNWFKKPKFLSFLSFTRLSGGLDYNLSQQRIIRANFGIEQKIFDQAILTMVYNKDFVTNYNFLNLGLRLEFQHFRSESSSRTINRDPGVYSELVQGSIGFDSDKMKVYFSNPMMHNNVGFGASSVRFYIDGNLNGKYDENEETINGVNFEIPNASMDNYVSSGFKNAYNLIPYSKYSLIVDKSSFKNPLITPTSNKISFIADPNCYKPIDVPCYAGGVIEGNIYNGEKHNELKNGFKIHIASTDGNYHETFPIFRDGSFYYMGVPPGEYVAYIDSTQLEVLNAKSSPEIINFKVNRTSDGDFIDDMNFTVQMNNNGSINEISTFNPAENGEPGSKEKNETNQKIQENKRLLGENIVENGGDNDKQSSNGLAEKQNEENDNINQNIEKTEKNNSTENSNSGYKNIQPEIPSLNGKQVEKVTQFIYKTAKMTFLTVQMQKELDKIAKYLVDHPLCKLQIDGHSDNFGSPDENMQVSIRRATEVANYLTLKGIKKDRLLTSGHGALFPITDNTSPEGRIKNRRVEIKITD